VALRMAAAGAVALGSIRRTTAAVALVVLLEWAGIAGNGAVALAPAGCRRVVVLAAATDALLGTAVGGGWAVAFIVVVAIAGLVPLVPAGAAAAVAVVAADLSTGHLNPFLNNTIALCIACELLEAVALDSYATALTVSLGLLAYDFVAVFQSAWLASAIASAGGQPATSQSMMVAVATRLDGPMKLIFPSSNPAAAFPFSILGLGDVVVPALTVALCLRADKTLQMQGQRAGRPGERPFFTAAMVGYVAGLLLTGLCFNLTQSAQPALVYICPSIVAATAWCAWRRGEWALLLAYRRPPEPTDADGPPA